MEESELQDLERALQAATPAPWRSATAAELEDAQEYRPHVVAPGPLYVAAIYDSLDEYDSNVRCIVALRNAAPSLISDLREARRLLGEAIETLGRYANHDPSCPAQPEAMLAFRVCECGLNAALDALPKPKPVGERSDRERSSPSSPSLLDPGEQKT